MIWWVISYLEDFSSSVTTKESVAIPNQSTKSCFLSTNYALGIAKF